MLQDNSEGRIVESTRFRGSNVVRCEINISNQQMPLIGAYLPPSTIYHLPDLEEALNRFPDRDPIILGEINADIGLLRNSRDQQVADLLASFRMVDLLSHF